MGYLIEAGQTRLPGDRRHEARDDSMKKRRPGPDRTRGDAGGDGAGVRLSPTCSCQICEKFEKL